MMDDYPSRVPMFMLWDFGSKECGVLACPNDGSYRCARCRHQVCDDHEPRDGDNRCGRCRELDGSDTSSFDPLFGMGEEVGT